MGRPGAALRAVLLLAGVSAAGAAWPQADDAVQLPAVVVTAQKIPQDERDVPLSIAVVDGERLERARIDTPDDLAQHVANAHFAGPLLALRGIGTYGIGFDPSVGVFIDGVYYGRTSAALAPLYDLAQVEVIRGPQGTLLGKNTIAGALLLTTAGPGPERDGEISALRGALGERSVQGAWSTPLGEEWGLRLAGRDDARGDYLVNSTPAVGEGARHLRGARAKLAWRPQGPWSAGLAVGVDEHRLDGVNGQLTAATDESLEVLRQYDPATEADGADYHLSTNMPDSAQARRGRGATLQAGYELGDANVTWLANVADSSLDINYDGDFGPIPSIEQYLLETYVQRSQELRIAGRWADLDYVAGIYGLWTDLGVDQIVVSFPEGSAGLAPGGVPPALLPPGVTPARDASHVAFRQDGRSIAAFGQGIWRVASAWSLTAAARWSRERKDLLASNDFEGSGAAFVAFVGAEEYAARRARREEDWSPRFALQFDASPDLALYATAARGFKSGGYNPAAANAQLLEFEPERSTTVEAGAKTALLDHTLAVNLAVFTTEYEDLQVTASTSTGVVTQNAARARIDGAELESRWRIGPGWSAGLSVGSLDARYVSYPDAPARSEPSSSSTTQDLGGQALQRAPRWSGALALEYESARFGPGLAWRGGVDALYRSHTFLNLDLDPIDAQPAYWQLNAAVGIGTQALSLTLAGRNLTDEVILVDGGDVFFFAGDHWGLVEAPRTWSASLQYRW
jgi:iron complex outermembrane recepter protein